MKKKYKLCCLISALLLLQAAAFSAASGEETRVSSDETSGFINTDYGSENSYSAYIHSLTGQYGEDVIVSDSKMTLSEGDTVTYKFSIPQTADYELTFIYSIQVRNEFDICVRIDDDIPFEEAEHIILKSYWCNSEERADGAGNEIAPEQIPSDLFAEASAADFTGRYDRPYRLRLDAGTHEIAVCVNSGTAAIEKISFTAPENPEEYTFPEKAGENNEVIIIEGEDASLKSSYSLISKSDSSNAEVSPNDPVKGRLNYIGGSNWKSSGDTIQWEFNADKSGYYSFGAVYRQNINIGAISYRHLKIDGITPFREAETLKFKYSTSWDYFSFGEEEPYLIWLDKGRHTLSLSITPGEMAKIYSELRDVSSAMGDLYIDITMIVGETVDIYRSYELFKQIPDYNERMNYCRDMLIRISEEIKRLQEKTSSSMLSSITGAIEILDKMLEQPYSAHTYKTAFYNSYTNLGVLVGSIVEMPLDIDRIFFVGNTADQPDFKVSFLENAVFNAKRFIATFSEDYDTVSSADSEDTLTIWVNWGRDQAQVLSSLINEDFAGKYETDVSVKVVNATLIQGILAGKGPDVMLQMGLTEPVNLAMRGALVDLSGFEDFDEVIDCFIDGSLTPYEYKDGTYALPDTQTFDMLFVRTDVFESMGLKIPENWEEFSTAATEIQRNNLQVYMPSTFYPTMLVQNGLPLYDIEEGISLLTGAEQIKCFTEYTDWFTKYKLPKTMDSFFNRFRIGSVPMGISSYGMINQLEVAAPEIAGRWTAVSLPGVIGENGETNYSSSAEGTGCGITMLSKNRQKAWQFLKWWVSADTQIKYSQNLESLLGPLGRVAAANSEAFSQLGWNADQLKELLDQRKNIVCLPQLPGGYYVTRGIDQAFWNVVEQNANPTDTILEWGEIVNDEMRRKRNEYK